MTKVAYNTCFGGFRLSYAAMMRYAELKGFKLYGFVTPLMDKGFGKMTPVDPKKADKEFCVHYRTSPDPDGEGNYFSDDHIDRADPILIHVIEEMGDKANGKHASIAIEDIPSGTRYRIDEYAGSESVMTIDSYDWSVA